MCRLELTGFCSTIGWPAPPCQHSSTHELRCHVSAAHRNLTRGGPRTSVRSQVHELRSFAGLRLRPVPASLSLRIRPLRMSTTQTNSSGSPLEKAATRDERFTVVNKRGFRLQCTWRKPRPDQEIEHEPVPVVVLVHGFRSTKEATVRKIAEQMDVVFQGQVGTVRMDLTGNGESEGEFAYANYEEEADDIRAVVEYAREHLNAKPVALGGHSKGGGSVMLYAAKYGDIGHLINLAGRYDMQRGVVERFGSAIVEKVQTEGSAPVTLKDGFTFNLTRSELETRLSMDMAAISARIPTSVQVLTIHGVADDIIPVKDADSFDAVVANHTLVKLDGAGHNFGGYVNEVVLAIGRFLDLRETPMPVKAGDK